MSNIQYLHIEVSKQYKSTNKYTNKIQIQRKSLRQEFFIRITQIQMSLAILINFQF